MPGRSGLEALSQIKQINAKLPVLILSIHPEEQYALRVLKPLMTTTGAMQITINNKSGL
jgi:DNA-binding NarL/FixJ family response regulator